MAFNFRFSLKENKTLFRGQLQEIVSLPIIVPLNLPYINLFFSRVNTQILGKENLKKANPGPLLVVSNHLSMYDTWLLFYGLKGLHKNIFDSKRIMWSLPEVSNFFSNPISSTLFYFLRCIPVNRKTDNKEENQLVYNKIRSLLENGHCVSVFGEGGRSRTGRLEKFRAIVIGKLCKETNCQVLPIYFQGMQEVNPLEKREESKFTFPKTKDQNGNPITIDFIIGEPFYPQTNKSGLKATLDLTKKTHAAVEELEKVWLEKQEKGESSEPGI